jgi:hypothetical protein
MTLEAINKHNMIFISAQPDNPYFHWQVEVYLYQFTKHGIIDRCYALFGYRTEKPSQEALSIAEKYKHIYFYKDNRDINEKHHYVPTIRPHILKQFFKDYPDLGKNVFYHDSDIFLVKLPKFELMLGNDIGYFSDTISYIGYKYIKNCGKKYKQKYSELNEDDIFIKMCKCVGISEDLVIKNEENAGGAQYLLKNIDSSFWEDVEYSCSKLHYMLAEYWIKYPNNNGENKGEIQKWCADMWCVLWLYWKRGKESCVIKELDFSWGTSSIEEYYKKNIFHLAGIINADSADKFNKGLYTKINPMLAYRKNPMILEHVSPGNATYGYISVLKELANTLVIKDVYKFILKSDKEWGACYIQDKSKTVCGFPTWRSDNNKFLIFNNKHGWVLTDIFFENELKEGSGGLDWCNGNDPYDNKWSMSTVEQIIYGNLIGCEIDKFLLQTKSNWAGVYYKDNLKILLGRCVWRSANGKYIIFHNKYKWIITDSRYEAVLKEDSGGYLASDKIYPYESWENCTVEIL